MIQKFEFAETCLKGLFLIKPFVAYDERGYFIKDYSEEIFQSNGIHHTLKEVFYTSSHKGVVRAIHFQRVKTQAKLIRCVKGKIFDVAVDLRKDSETYGKWAGFCLSEENKNELYIPGEFGHGYLVLEPSIVAYKCSEKFYGEYDDGIKWDDADIGIDWPVDGVDNIILSEKDRNLQSFKQFTDKYGGL
jgi:dTDP-4-dehydrorhamnose 3,5-epimerase